MSVSRWEKEKALRLAGIAIQRYPVLDQRLAAIDQAAADRALIQAGNAWDREIDRLYLILLQSSEHFATNDSVSDERQICWL